MTMPLDKSGAQAEIADNPAMQRFEISVDTGDGTSSVVGFALYRDRTDDDGRAQRIFFHTEVDEAFGGRGLGTLLVRGALEAMRDNGTRVVPVCPLFAAYLRKHDDFADIVDRPTREIMADLREQTT
ncbi:GNAT family N-acetyltransferase [Williamsia sp. M5A3_1d]